LQLQSISLAIIPNFNLGPNSVVDKDLIFKAKAKDLTSRTRSLTALKMFSLLDLCLAKWSLNFNHSFCSKSLFN